MQINELIGKLNQWAPPSYQEGYDNAGLIAGDGGQKIKGVLVCLDCVEAVIDEAVEKQCNLVIAHHPILFKATKSLTGKNYVERTIIKAIKNDVAIFAMHTNLDNVATGVNAKIAEKLGVAEPFILSPKKGGLKKLFTFAPSDRADEVRSALFEAGGGHIGDYDQCSFNQVGTGTFRALDGTDPYVGEKGKQHKEKEEKIELVFPSHIEDRLMAALLKAHPYEEVAYDVVGLDNPNFRVGSGMIGELENPEGEKAFMSRLKSTFKTGVVRHTALLNKQIKKVAFCGGAGSFLLNTAISRGADVFITGDFKYHEFFDTEGHIVIMDIGHYESEQFTIDLIGDYLKEKFSTFAVHLTEVNTNPVNYF